jgi:hypothetical protein
VFGSHFLAGGFVGFVAGFVAGFTGGFVAGLTAGWVATRFGGALTAGFFGFFGGFAALPALSALPVSTGSTGVTTFAGSIGAGSTGVTFAGAGVAAGFWPPVANTITTTSNTSTPAAIAMCFGERTSRAKLHGVLIDAVPPGHVSGAFDAQSSTAF